AGVFEGLGGSDDGQLHEAIEPLRLFAVEVVADLDVDLTGDADAEVRGVEVGDRPYPVLGVVLALEERRGAHAYRRDGAQSGNDNSSHQLIQGTRPARRGTCRQPGGSGYCLLVMNLTASPTVRMPSASSSEISTPNSS